MANTTTLTSGNVMDQAAALMNDNAKAVYTYVTQLPYLNMALQDLQEHYEQNEIPVVDSTSVEITVPANTAETVDIVFANPSVSGTNLPDDLVEPTMLWERDSSSFPYTPMTKVDVLDRSLVGQQISQFIWYIWNSQKITVFGADQDNTIKMNYIRNLFVTLAATDGSDQIPIINARGYLQYRTARHLSFYIAENPTRAEELEIDAQAALDRILGIGTKPRQAIVTRRRPFRASYKRGSMI